MTNLVPFHPLMTGYFKIKRGHNECGIENDINAGLPDVSKFV